MGSVMRGKMTYYAIIVPKCLYDVAYQVVVKNVRAIVEDVLYEDGTSTIVITSDLEKIAVEKELREYLYDENVEVCEISNTGNIVFECEPTGRTLSPRVKKSMLALDLEKLDEETVFFVEF